MSDSDQKELKTELEKQGLRNPRWIQLLKKENIGCHKDIPENVTMLYNRLKCHAKGDDEVIALRKFLKIKDSQLETKLQESGLNHICWTPKFESVGVQTLEQLKLLEGDKKSYSKLKSYVKFDHERKALWSLLKLDEMEKQAKARREERIQKAKQKEEDLKTKEEEKEKQRKCELQKQQKEAQQLLKDLKTLCSDTKTQHDDRVNKLREKVEGMMDIPSKQTEDKFTADKIKELEENLDKHFGTGIEVVNCNFPDNVMIRHSSGGLALQGVLISHNLDDQLQPRDILLQIPENSHLSGPTIDPEDRFEDFTCKEMEERHRQSVSAFGMSLATAANFPAYGGAVTAEASAAASLSSESKNTYEKSTQTSYHSRVKYCKIPTKSFSFQLRDIEFSSNALKDLELIESVLIQHGPKGSQFQQKCEDFFNNYGSHVSRGPMHFGGIYWWTCSSEGFDESELTTVQDLQAEALSTKVGVSSITGVGGSAEVNIEHVKSSYKKDFHSKTLTKTRLVITRTGGPTTISAMPEWKKALATNNSTWSVIDRSYRFTPIWSVLESNYIEEFSHAPALVTGLKNAWEKMTGLHIKSVDHGDVLDNINEWCQKAQPDKIEEHIEELVSIRTELIEKAGDVCTWSEQYLPEPTVQKYFEFVVDSCDSSRKDQSPVIFMHLRILIPERDLHKLGTKQLQDRVQKLLYFQKPKPVREQELECSDIKSLSNFLDQAKRMITEGQDREATLLVQRAITSLRQQFYADKIYDDLFLLTIFFPFTSDSIDDNLLLNLSYQNLEYLDATLGEKYDSFEKSKESSMHVQAYLFKTAVEIYLENTARVSDSRAVEHLKYIENRIGNRLEGIIVNTLSARFSDSSECEWDKFHYDLKSLLQKEMHTDSRVSSNSLYLILNRNQTMQQSPTEPEYPDQQDSTESSTKELLVALDLYGSKRLSLDDCIRLKPRELEKQHCTDPAVLPLLTLHKIMTYDISCRKVLLEQEYDINPSCEDDSFVESDDNFDEDDECVPCPRQALISINPQDAILAVLLSSSDFIRQDLIERLAICQFAVPLIIPQPFNKELTLMLWGMRSIVKEWKTSSNVSVECPIISHPMPVITFLRFKKHKRSKSKILNSVIGHAVSYSHQYYFHRDCEGGNMERHLGDGLVDVCWYLPIDHTNKCPEECPDEDSKTKRKIVRDSLAFLNLHGNACDHPQQVAFLSKVSSMCFIILKDEDLNESSINVIQQFSRLPGGIVLLRLHDSPLQSDKKGMLIKAIPNIKSCLQSSQIGKANDDDIKTNIVNRILRKVNDLSKEGIALEDSVAHAAGEDIQIDEAGSTVLKEAFRKATECKRIIDKLDPKSAKESALPLQGKNFWWVWAQLDKKQHEEMKSDIAILEGRKNALRRAQNKAAEHMSPFMSTFLSQILSTPRNIRVYYLQYLKLYFDDYSRTHLRKLAQRYETDLAQNPTRKHPEIRQKYYKQLSTASLGLEHVFREVSQVYEAATSQSLKCSDRLPRVAAELLIDGYPLELLDGDTGHVPLTWVKAVLGEVTTLLNDPNVFVLSVLGLQSSGKSTLLNSTFGLKFAVSAGRCTRGAYMQLLPLDEKLQKELKCDYLLVVDTEGLRAPELESRQRIKSDNKLATFAVGLANVTLINIYGEVPGDIDDILQTLIHAFIRMRRVKLKASCQFVHQNVSSTSALLRGKMGRTLFRDKLDSVTKDIAKAEGCGKSFTCFNDVISFDMEEDVHYFPGLWNGVLPMATVSQGYCDKARVLRKRIIGLMKNKENPLSSFGQRLEDLWKALLHDDFVLSFKNSLEAIAFKSLEAEYGNWSWELKDAILTWSEESNTQISNCESEELSDLSSRLISELNDLANKVQCDLEKKIHAFFKTSKHADLLQAYKHSKKEQLSLLKNSMVLNAQNQCKQAVEVKKANFDISGIRNKYDTKIRDELSTLAENLKEENGDTLHQVFDLRWSDWMQELRSECKPVDQLQVNVSHTVEDALRQAFPGEHGYINSKLHQRKLIKWGSILAIDIDNDTHFEILDSSWRSTVAHYANWQRSPAETYSKRLKQAADQVLQSVDVYLKTQNNDNGFYSMLPDKLIKTLKGRIYTMVKSTENSEAKSSWKRSIRVTKEFDIDMHLIACGYAIPIFQRMAEEYKRKHDPVQYFQDKKDFYSMYFTNLHSKAAVDVAAASIFCHNLHRPIKDCVMMSLGQAIVNDMRKTHRFLQTKSSLKAQILIDLAENLQNEKTGAIEGLCFYLESPELSIFNWLRRYVVFHCNQSKEGGMTNLVYIAREKLTDLFILIAKKVRRDDKVLQSQGSSMDGNKWLSEFCSDRDLKRKLSWELTATHYSQFKVLNVASFFSQVIHGMDSLERELQEEFKSMEISDIEKLSTVPHVVLFESLEGCLEVCPFCKEQCEREFKHSDNHSITQHRPQCLGGTNIEKSSEMVMSICNEMVGSTNKFQLPKEEKWHQFKDYNQVFPSWFIKHDRSTEASSYWKWLLGNYSSVVAEHYNITKKVDGIPSSWSDLKWEEVRAALIKEAMP